MSVFKRAAFLEKVLEFIFITIQNQFIVEEKSFFIRFLLKILPLPLKLEVLLVLKPEAKQKQSKSKKQKRLLFCFTLNKRATLLLRTVTTSQADTSSRVEPFDSANIPAPLPVAPIPDPL
jgi:hypothetical protein